MMVQPGWHAIVPCERDIRQVYLAIESPLISKRCAGAAGLLGIFQAQSLSSRNVILSYSKMFAPHFGPDQVPSPWELDAWSLLLFPEEAEKRPSSQHRDRGTAARPDEAFAQDRALADLPADMNASRPSSGHAAVLSVSVSAPAVARGNFGPDSTLDNISDPSLGFKTAVQSSGTIFSWMPPPASGIPPADVSLSQEPCRTLLLQQYGERAAAHVRLHKRRKLSAAAKTTARDTEPCRFAQDPSFKRKRHLSSLKENELGALVATLQQPQHQQHDSHLDCLQSLHNIVNLTRLPGTDNASPVDKLRQSSLKVYRALEVGDLDIPLHLSSAEHGRQMTLRDLTNIPDDQHGRLFAGMNQQIVNAMALKRFEGDAAHLTMQRCAGAIGLLGCVFFRTNSGLHLHGKVLVDGRHLHMQEEQACLDPAEIMRILQLDARQAEAAHRIWSQAMVQLSRLQTEQGKILSRIRLGDAQSAAWQQSATCSASHQSAGIWPMDLSPASWPLPEPYESYGCACAAAPHGSDCHFFRTAVTFPSYPGMPLAWPWDLEGL
ncbi:hypothetical protein WJX84_002673 [Apatococcus fuscideae]|uniref:Uncharacterized protein n=1 Tax=Apatococcus fuscideae TaxID=2026836 RepID=A0AAW1TAI8_9CHLO